MTELAQILNDAKDTIFKVNFRCQPSKESVHERLQVLELNQIKNADEIKELSKSLIEGEECTLIGHLTDGGQELGRTLVIDLENPGFKQVDHRTIQWIIIRNTKYVLGKKSQEEAPEAEKRAEKWDCGKLALGNWFSEVQYYKFIKKTGKDFEVQINKESGSENYTISADQVEDMRSGSQFERVEKVTRSEMVALLQNAKNTVFTCTFRKKIRPSDVQELLNNVKTKKELQGQSLAERLIEGQEHTITGFLAQTEAALGRSLVIDLNKPYGEGFRQIDHRTIENLIICNVEY